METAAHAQVDMDLRDEWLRSRAALEETLQAWVAQELGWVTDMLPARDFMGAGAVIRPPKTGKVKLGDGDK